MRHILIGVACSIICGCAMQGVNVETLQQRGLRQITMRPPGDQKENPNYTLWVRELANGVQREICLAPRVSVQEYIWGVTVSVDGVQRWSSNNTVYGSSDNRTPVDCVTSGPLPVGQVNYESRFQYKAHKSSMREEPKTIHQAPPTPLATPASPPAKRTDTELESRLRTLKDLREKNLITEEQYQAATSDLLKKLTQ